jgi:hypothetical protein
VFKYFFFFSNISSFFKYFFSLFCGFSIQWDKVECSADTIDLDEETNFEFDKDDNYVYNVSKRVCKKENIFFFFFDFYLKKKENTFI